MTMRQLIILGLALAGVMHANILDDVEGAEDEGDAEEEGVEEPADEMPAEALSEETVKALFQKIDKDRDGKVVASELLAFALHMRTKMAEESHEQTWEDKDQDKDGKLSLAEVRDMESSEMAFKAADVDGDGFLNKEESLAFHFIESSPAVEHAVAKFEMKVNDKDGDDKLNVDEFAELYGTTEESEEEEQEEMREFAKESFGQLDKNKDGLLDVKEMQAYESGRHHEEESLTKMAQYADKDGDGFITLQEMLSSVDPEDAAEHFYYMDSWAQDLEL